MIDVWVTMFSLLMGTTMWLILGSIITTLLIHLNAAHSEYTAKMTALSQYMMENNLPQVHVYPLLCYASLNALDTYIALTHAKLLNVCYPFSIAVSTAARA